MRDNRHMMTPSNQQGAMHCYAKSRMVTKHKWPDGYDLRFVTHPAIW